jgi:hypothetical protein
MPTQTIASEVADEQRDTATAPTLVRVPARPYAAPRVTSYELDPHDVGSGDALTANG